MNDMDYMRLALELADRGRGWTNPNPMVGAVIVKNGRVIGEGYHHRCGGLHAEREAFAACTGSPAGATMYVTLEPCCHHGRQPPCTEAILESGISRVVVGSGDPNPLVAGKGLEFLRAHGVEVETGVLQKECDALNHVFFHYIRIKRPYVVMKYAMTIDGKIATRTGASRWITGEEARRWVHQDHHRYTAIMAGVGTVLADDPLLTCRRWRAAEIPSGSSATPTCERRWTVSLSALPERFPPSWRWAKLLPPRPPITETRAVRSGHCRSGTVMWISPPSWNGWGQRKSTAYCWRAAAH